VDDASQRIVNIATTRRRLIIALSLLTREYRPQRRQAISSIPMLDYRRLTGRSCAAFRGT